jgi:hypothetical protein
MSPSRNSETKTKIKPQEIGRWESEGGNPDPRYLEAKNAAHGHKIVEILRGLFAGWKHQAST